MGALGIGAALPAGPATTQEAVVSPQGRCVVMGERPTREELPRALQLGDDCLESGALEPGDKGLHRVEDECPQGSSLALNILFQFDSDALTIDAQRLLQTVATVMTDFPTCRFLLEGHTDATDPEEYHLDLSNRRAQAVEEHLRALKVEPERLSAVGYGETQLLFPEGPLTSDNRRVEIAIRGSVEEARR